MPRRVATDQSLLAESSLRSRASTLPWDHDTGPFQQIFPAYEGFPWEKIEAFLKKKWPQWTTFKQVHVGDKWEFEVPEKLTKGDMDALRRLRDQEARSRQLSQSPEP